MTIIGDECIYIYIYIGVYIYIYIYIYIWHKSTRPPPPQGPMGRGWVGTKDPPPPILGSRNSKKEELE